MSAPMNLSRKARLLAAASATCLLLATQGLAQQPSTPARQESSGNRIDSSRVRDLVGAPSTEREGTEFDGLSPSAILSEARKVLQPSRPDQITALEVSAGSDTFVSGQAILLPMARERLASLAEELRGKRGLRFEIQGHTDNQRISQRLKAIYPDNQALSEARARTVAQYLNGRLELPVDRFATVGFADTQPVASNVTSEGMAANRRTLIRVWYENVIAATPVAAVETVVQADACAPTVSLADLPFSISVDGRPIDADTTQTEADRQRCVDVALDRADIQIKYDPLNVAPALNAWTTSQVVPRGDAITWRSYSNYSWWIKNAEVRVFQKGQSTTETPLAVVPLNVGSDASWTPPIGSTAELGYVLRVFDDAGHFDETAVKAVTQLDAVDLERQADRVARDDLSGWGQSSLKLQNIPVSGGSVTISGVRIGTDESVAAMGMPVPVDSEGRFAIRQILPAGPQKVAVSLKDKTGKVTTFERNLSIADKDWFYFAVGDLTASKGRTTGPAPLVTTDTDHYDKKTTLDGRAAFYLKGKILGGYLLTASADTREQPLKDLFSNFGSKDPNYLLRRIDPNRYYPVYGDDSVIIDDAPTQGKFYVRLERDASHVMWGNFQTSWTGTELTQYSRGLYGGDVIWNSQTATSSGERRSTLEAFAADPGTLQSRQEFRGTGGSLYYLRQQDVTQGSERLWVEVRDKDSGIVLQRTLLAPSQDYDIDYLQGRLTLRSPLPSVASGATLVQSSGLDGNPIYLVSTYEYVPGLSRVNGTTVGVRVSHWLADSLRLGATYYEQGDGTRNQTLQGLDFLLRPKPNSWLKGEFAHSDGAGEGDFTSLTGGFDFTQNRAPASSADAYRLDAALDLEDLGGALRGRLTAYAQDRGRGYSAPGLLTPGGEALRQAGFSAVVPLGDHTELALKADDRSAISQSTTSLEAAIRHKLNAEWGLSGGIRYDNRSSNTVLGVVTNASPDLSRSGERSDAILRLDYHPLADNQSPPTGTSMPSSSMSRTYGSDSQQGVTNSSGPTGSLLPGALSNTPGVIQTFDNPVAAVGVAATPDAGLIYEPWNLYGFVQETLSRSGNRITNNRAGVGGEWQVSDRLRLGAEISGGEAGAGGKLSGGYQLDDRSNLYLTYARETEVADQNYAGAQGVLTFGGRTRLNDQLGVFAETRSSASAGPSSLTNAFGLEFAPAKHWTSGLKLELGKLRDPLAGDLRREGVSLNLGYNDDQLKVLSGIEYRNDHSSSLGTVPGVCSTTPLATPDPCVSAPGSNDRQTVLVKNSLSYKYDKSLRFLGVLNLSRSTSSQGAFYDGDYSEFVLGAAYRPVDNDRWNTLAKYTYFNNLPASSQVNGTTPGPLDYAQRSHVLNLDTTYDVNAWLSIGGKYGLKVGDLRTSRTSGPWYSSQAQLFVLRGDLHFVKEWDGILELRSLDLREAGDTRSGALVGIYRHVGEHTKVGVGYNFTDFSDDLTDLSYRSRGLFFNVLATF